MAKPTSNDDAVLVAASGAALVASILANLKQAGANTTLRRSVEALQRLVQDWQQAYHNIDAQLTLAQLQNRRPADDAQARTHPA